MRYTAGISGNRIENICASFCRPLPPSEFFKQCRLDTLRCEKNEKKKPFSFSFITRWHRHGWKCLCSICPVSYTFAQCCPRSRPNDGLLERRSLSTSFLNSSFLKAINAAVLWFVFDQRIPQGRKRRKRHSKNPSLSRKTQWWVVDRPRFFLGGGKRVRVTRKLQSLLIEMCSLCCSSVHSC